MKKLVRTINPFSPKKRLEKSKTNKEINLINEFQFDMEWWEKNFAIEWWNNNGHFNDTLYRDYLFAKIDSQKQLN